MMKKAILFVFVCLSAAPLLISQEYLFDDGHTFVQFSVNRFGAVDVIGRFNKFSGTLNYDEASQMISKADFSVDVESIDTGHKIRDGHLQGTIWLDVENHPQITFSAASFSKTETGFNAAGVLTIKGVAKEVEIPFQMSGPEVDPTQTKAIGVSTELIINRHDYGISLSKLMKNGLPFIGNDVKIRIDALAIQSKE
jgi:polyisoprenoid-binding protein YceI